MDHRFIIDPTLLEEQLRRTVDYTKYEDDDDYSGSNESDYSSFGSSSSIYDSDDYSDDASDYSDDEQEEEEEEEQTIEQAKQVKKIVEGVEEPPTADKEEMVLANAPKIAPPVVRPFARPLAKPIIKETKEGLEEPPTIEEIEEVVIGEPPKQVLSMEERQYMKAVQSMPIAQHAPSLTFATRRHSSDAIPTQHVRYMPQMTSHVPSPMHPGRRHSVHAAASTHHIQYTPPMNPQAAKGPQFVRCAPPTSTHATSPPSPAPKDNRKGSFKKRIFKDTDISKILDRFRITAFPRKSFSTVSSSSSFGTRDTFNCSSDKPPTRSVSMSALSMKTTGLPSSPPKQNQQQEQLPPPPPLSNESPLDVYKAIVHSQGQVYEQRNANDMVGFFEQITDGHIRRYTQDLTNIVRNEDIDTLRDMHAAGMSLRACNRFGESILHMACRRGAVEVVQFLVIAARVSLKIKDDYGRTPLHDAFWTVSLNSELILFLISKCPQLMMVSDSRGFVPLNYVRQEQWPTVCAFLRRNAAVILPTRGF